MTVVAHGTDVGWHYGVLEVSLGAELPTVDRIDMWHEHVGHNHGPVHTRIEWPEGFSGRTWTQRALTTRGGTDSGMLQLVEFASSAIDYTRSNEVARNAGDDSARLIIPIDGRILLAQSDHAVCVEPGRMGILRWNQDMAMSHGDDFRAYILNIPAYALPPARDPRGALGIQPKNFILNNIRRMVDSLAADRRSVTAPEFVEFSRAIVDLVAGTLDDRRAPELDAHARLVADARRRIHLYSNDSDLTVRTLAESLGISRRQLETAMKKVAGRTPGQVLRETRLRRAYDLLADPDATEDVVDVATACGYSSLSGFRTSFVDRFGILPGEVKHRARSSQRPAPRPEKRAQLPHFS
ncbi:helix-turn-helix transcriptional regulator [Nocardia jiangxiensis]|uniref:AraC family transcriptional regulator n=1 Tax=Nocardia jiangxiensis TaxID=282685 RepID=A0ABW6S5R5_9NOCA|nr:AraC family transcriptional regulator [Nocardia jiangxiensis]